ncbi:MAG: cyclic nucleotide-binding domain-containing protein, partial [Anaerovoracaceae bacterium]
MKITKEYLPFWDKLTKKQQDFLLANAHLTKYDKDAQVHSGGNDCIGILLIQQGTLRTYMLSEDGREITLFRMKEGDVCVLSASCILSAVTFDVHIDAETPAEIIQINTAAFQHLADENIYVENFMYKVAL